jgi:uroporphyrinogen-III synthase
MIPLPLAGRRIALPEHRELDRLAQMLEDQGAEAVRCPLVAILDAPDPAPVRAWIERFVAAPPDDLILLTGEGLRRLYRQAQRDGRDAPFVAALAGPRKIIRGPKPGRALRELGLREDLRAAEPTTDGVIATLSQHDLLGHRIGVQLYPGNPNDKLLDFLRAAGAMPDPIVPYAYASDADDRRIGELIAAMAAGRIDVIAFTSSAQVGRLFEAAKAAGRQDELAVGLARARIAAVGPVVAETLARRGITVAIAPHSTYFMKPLVSAIIGALADG